MGTYGLQGVLEAWKVGRLTTEQAVGQILLLLAQLEGRIAELERTREAPPQRDAGRSVKRANVR